MTVIIPKKVYLTIVAASARFANQRIEKDEWLEVSGVLIGRNERKKKNTNVIISAAYPIMHQELDKEAIIDQYKWNDEDYLALSIIDDEAFSKGEFTVGWWHSHPGFKVMMSHIDIQTTLSYQQNNPLAISLVFNPQRLLSQVELPDKKGDPVFQLVNDPGFKIFRLNDVNRGIHTNYHEVDYKIEGFKNMGDLIKFAQNYILNVANFFPKDNIFDTYDKFVKERITKLNSLILGTEEYLKTLTRQGESHRIPEVLENQKKEINRYVAETFIKIENVKEFMDFLEYKERELIIPKVNEILSEWDDKISTLSNKIEELSKKF
ncbi:MAG: Mov34/MPN/PAD-1 family protein [Promethearchaeota archaeon]